MKKRFLACLLMLYTSLSHAANKPYTGPDCSQDLDANIVDGLVVSFDNNKNYDKYIDTLLGRDVKRKITRLSSEKISKAEAKRLMFRFAKNHRIDKNDVDLKPGGSFYIMYVSEDLYRQYYLIETNKGFKAIAEYYSVGYGKPDPFQACGADLENIYVISDTIYGHTSNFADR